MSIPDAAETMRILFGDDAETTTTMTVLEYR
jgi:hypothetical protein